MFRRLALILLCSIFIFGCTTTKHYTKETQGKEIEQRQDYILTPEIQKGITIGVIQKIKKSKLDKVLMLDVESRYAFMTGLKDVVRFIEQEDNISYDDLYRRFELLLRSLYDVDKPILCKALSRFFDLMEIKYLRGNMNVMPEHDKDRLLFIVRIVHECMKIVAKSISI